GRVEPFGTPSVQADEDQVLKADERSLRREAEIFEARGARVAAQARRIQASSRAAAALDTLAALAEVSSRHNYVKPRLTTGDELFFVEGRHPVMERVLADPFVANDLRMGEDAPRLFILTGPNMGGKSTYLRQAALMVVMAQMGC